MVDVNKGVVVKAQRQITWTVALVMMLSALLGAGVFSAQGAETEVTPVVSSSALISLLPDKLAGLKATSDLKQFTSDNLQELVNDAAAIFREYRVTSAVAREYGRVRVEVFETKNQFSAYGLFSSGVAPGMVREPEQGLGSGGAQIGRDVVFWKGSLFVRVTDSGRFHENLAVHEAAARAVADAIQVNTAVVHPPLFESLPAQSIVPDSKRYFLGPESLSVYVQHSREMFLFEGDTEAVMAAYVQPGAAAAQPQDSLLKLVIVECHTPPFATDAMSRATDYVSSLPEPEQQKILVKRTGNYIVEASNVRDREFAQGLIDSVQYPYTVKWLRNPLWPTNDPFRTQKAAQMLLSTFGVLGLILMTVLGVGSVFGTMIFLKRRRRQQEIFSDAGGMLRLELDQFESVIIGLPAKRSEE